MGLDMYVFRAKKITAEEAEAINEKMKDKIDGITLMPCPESDTERAMMKDIEPFLTKVRVKARHWDMDNLKNAIGYKSECRIIGSCYSKDKITLTIANRKGNSKDIVIDRAKMDDFTKIVDEESYAVKLEEVAYWRKHYDLQEKMYRYYKGNIYNCGFHRVNGDMMRYIRKDPRYSDLKTSKDLFYHEWY